MAPAYFATETVARLSEAILSKRIDRERPIIVGLCGPQGAGKSTLTAQLERAIRATGFTFASLSLDDVYLTRGERQVQAGKIHPLLATRGVPGTHDLALLNGTIDRILAASAGEIVALPSFDKAIDDRRPAGEWPRHVGGADVILLEGWCVSVRPESEGRLVVPINALEREEDAEGRWRGYVNERLSTDYATLFARLDLTILLRAPGFDVVHDWRAEQERGLDRSAAGSRPPMTDAELDRFISHYERLTRWLLADEPADIIVDLATDRRMTGWRYG